MSTNGQATATVEVLSAEVRVLMVGRRQVTLSVYRQLDEVSPDDIEPFGRVNDSKDNHDYIWGVGRHSDEGTLVRARLAHSRPRIDVSGLVQPRLSFGRGRVPVGPGGVVVYWGAGWSVCCAHTEVTRDYWPSGRMDEIVCLAREESEGWQAVKSLPLIVLAGLR